MDIPRRIGRYDVVEKLGEGGMGVLYLARDSSLGRPVAIKVLSVVNAELRERFSREARSVARLKHQHIVTIYDIGEDQGRPYIAMEYLDGETLGELIRRRRPLPLARKLELMLELCAGLGYAHRAGIIHRDIKPANVMITADGMLKILDFGLARLANEDTTAGLTVAGALIGTPHYMSPEQIEGKPVDHRADIFGVGALFYELIAYRKAFPGDAWQSVFLRILSGPPPQPLGDLSVGLDPEIQRIVDLCVARDPAARYADLSLMAGDLHRVCDRVRADLNQSTVRIRPRPVDAAGDGGGGKPVTPSPTPLRAQNPEAMAKRRAARVQAYLAKAADDLHAGDLESVIEQCEMAMLLDAGSAEASELLDEANRGLEDREVLAWLAEAEAHLATGSLSEAASRIEDALHVRPDSAPALQLQRALAERRLEEQRRNERARAAQRAVDRARAGIRDGSYEAAFRSASEALAYEPDNAEALDLKRDAAAGLEEQHQRLREQQVREVMEDARRLADGEHYEPALRLLGTLPFAHPSVDDLRAVILDEASRRSDEEASPRASMEAEQRANADARRSAQAETQRRTEAARQEMPVETLLVEEERPFRVRIEANRRAEAVQRQPIDVATPKSGIAPSEPIVKTLPRWRRRIQVGVAALVLMFAGGVWMAKRQAVDRATVSNPEAPTPDRPVEPGTSVAAETSPGTLIVDALPWAEVTEILDAQGRQLGLDTGRYTPFAVLVPPGAYRLTLKDPGSQAVRVVSLEVRSGRSERALVEFKKIDAAEYFRNAGWTGAR